MSFRPHLRILRLIKLVIWTLRLQRWERIYNEVANDSCSVRRDFSFEESERKMRRLKSLQWKIQGAQERIARYGQKHQLFTDLSGG